MRLAKGLGIAGVLVITALIGGTLIGTVLATENDGDPNPLDADAPAYCDTFMDALASELETTRDELVEASQAAANAAIDAAVDAGDLTEERAAQLRERIAGYDGDGCGLFGRAFGHGGRNGPGLGGFGRGFLASEAFDAAAEALGLDRADLLAQVRGAGSLQVVAEDAGASYDDVKAAVVAAAQSEVDAAVARGDFDQERADAIIGRVTTWLDEGGEVHGPRGPQGRGDQDSDEDDAR